MAKTLTLKSLQIFDVVARQMSLSRAAEELRVSQPYISGEIASLEVYLETLLFRRVGRRVYLTDAGRTFGEYVGRILETILEAERSLGGLRSLSKGTLTIAASSTPGAYLIPRMLRGFLMTYPGVDVRLRIQDKGLVEQAVLQGRAELGIVASRPEGHFDTKVLGPDELVLVVSRKHPWANRSEIDISDLVSERLIVRERTSGTRARIEEELKRSGVAPRTWLEVGNVEAVKQSISSGLGVSFLSQNAIKQDSGNRHLSAVRIKGKSLKREFCLMTLGPKSLSPAGAVMKQFLVSHSGPLEIDYSNVRR